MPTTVAATDWAISYRTCATQYDGALLAVHAEVDLPNEWGGRGVVVYHPEYHGMSFDDVDAAQAFALEVGLVRPWNSGEAALALTLIEATHAASLEAAARLAAEGVR